MGQRGVYLSGIGGYVLLFGDIVVYLSGTFGCVLLFGDMTVYLSGTGGCLYKWDRLVFLSMGQLAVSIWACF